MPATIVRVTIKVDPADAQTVIDAITECWTELSFEPELLYYDASQSVTDPGTFYQVELWARDAEYLQNVCSHILMRKLELKPSTGSMHYFNRG